MKGRKIKDESGIVADTVLTARMHMVGFFPLFLRTA